MDGVCAKNAFKTVFAGSLGENLAKLVDLVQTIQEEIQHIPMGNVGPLVVNAINAYCDALPVSEQMIGPLTKKQVLTNVWNMYQLQHSSTSTSDPSPEEIDESAPTDAPEPGDTEDDNTE